MVRRISRESLKIENNLLKKQIVYLKKYGKARRAGNVKKK